jgi:uncharacterized membrane protein
LPTAEAAKEFARQAPVLEVGVPATQAPRYDESQHPLSSPSLRLLSIDFLRGLAVVLMTLDHTRDFFTGAAPAPEDIHHTTGPLFFTRFVTHFCAPTFFLLAGMSAYLALSRGASRADVSRFLWTRGLWLVFLDLTVVSFGWTSLFPFLFSDVLWSLGWCMVAMALLIRLPVPVVAGFGAVVIVTHNLLDSVNPTSLGKFAGLWMILYGYGDFWVEPHKVSFWVLWPIIPWLGVMAMGYALAALLRRNDWPKIVFFIGLGLFSSFAVLRFFHLYGNSHHHFYGPAAGRWHVRATLTLTIVSFFDTLKYPPSLQFLLMTLGPILMALALLGRSNWNNWFTRTFAVFGSVPLFFYLVHIYVIRTLAVYTALLFKQKAVWLLQGGFMLKIPPDGYGHGLSFIYGMWFGIVLFMYPLCWWFMNFKRRHPDWLWLRYL